MSCFSPPPRARAPAIWCFERYRRCAALSAPRTRSALGTQDKLAQLGLGLIWPRRETFFSDLICHLAHLRLPSPVLIDGGHIQSKFWSLVTNQMDAFLKWRRHQVFIERSFTVTVTFFYQQLPSCTLGEEWRRNVILTFEQFPFFSRDCKGMKDCRCFQSDWGLCWKTVIYQWSVQPLVRKDIFFLSMVRLEDCLWKVRWSTLHRK